MSDAAETNEQRFEKLGLELPPPPGAVGVYKPAITVGGMVYTSGHLPINTDGSIITGCVGHEIDQDAGYEAARQCGLAILATLRQHLGSLDRVKRVIKLTGMVNSTQAFTGQPAVVNGCSELMASVFGEDAGVGTRSAVGMSGLPLGAAVEIEGMFEIDA
ncbi:MAG: RidA family protein [Planctomycetota bacterium]